MTEATPESTRKRVLVAGASGLARRALARTVAGAADLTLAASPELAGLATRLGARDVRVAPVVVPELPPATLSAEEVREDLGVTGPMLLSVGRRPYTDGLGLAEAGVALDNGGRVITDTLRGHFVNARRPLRGRPWGEASY